MIDNLCCENLPHLIELLQGLPACTPPRYDQRIVVSACSASEQHHAGNRRSRQRITAFVLNPLQRDRLEACGNGVLDDLEECDCGAMEHCEEVDPCCDPITCRLKEGSECSKGLCCDNCK
ncbi:unnamed protein product, partial [Notodromas monacha]